MGAENRRVWAKAAAITAFFAVLVLLLALCVAFWQVPKARSAPTGDPAGPRLIAGHRGTTIGEDENTIAAMNYALPYADVLEFDVRLTGDNPRKMVIMHDSTLDRTTSCSGRVSEKSLDSIKRCRTDRGHHPPSLRGLLTWAEANAYRKADHLTVLLDLKGTWTQSQAQHLVNEAARYDLKIIFEGQYDTLAKITKALGYLPDEYVDFSPDLAPIRPEHTEPSEVARICRHYEGVVKNLDYMEPGTVSYLQETCNPPTWVAVYGKINTDVELQQAYETGARMIIAENPKHARDWLNKR